MNCTVEFSCTLEYSHPNRNRSRKGADMRKIITWAATTLDGYMEGPGGEGDLGWLMPYVAESVPDNSRLLGEEIDTILLGRLTYQGFSQYWPHETGEFADLMNKPPKLVFSGHGALDKATWGSY